MVGYAPDLRHPLAPREIVYVVRRPTLKECLQGIGFPTAEQYRPLVIEAVLVYSGLALLYVVLRAMFPNLH